MNKTNTKTKEKVTLHNLFYNNRFVLIFSIIASFVLWVAISLTAGTETTKVIEEVPVKINYEESVPNSLNLKMFGDIPKTVNVSVKAKRYVVNTLTEKDVTATVTLNDILTVGTENIQIKTVKANKNVEFDIVSTSQTSFRAYFDYYREAELPVEAVVKANQLMPEGYITQDPILSSSAVKVSGPATYVDMAKRILATATVELPLTQTTTVEPVLIGVDSQNLELPYLTINEDKPLTMTIPILKETSLNIEVNFTNAPQTDMAQYVKSTISPSTVRVAGEEKYIDGLKTLLIGQIDYQDIPVSKKVFTFATSNFKELQFLDNIKEITVTIEASNVLSAEFTLPNANMTLHNTPDGYEATILSKDINNVVLVGPQEELATIVKEDVIANIDLGNITLHEGKMKIRANIQVKNKKYVWTYGVVEIEVQIQKKI